MCVGLYRCIQGDPYRLLHTHTHTLPDCPVCTITAILCHATSCQIARLQCRFGLSCLLTWVVPNPREVIWSHPCTIILLSLHSCLNPPPPHPRRLPDCQPGCRETRRTPSAHIWSDCRIVCRLGQKGYQPMLFCVHLRGALSYTPYCRYTVAAIRNTRRSHRCSGV